MSISGNSDIRMQSVSPAAAYAKLAGTPLQPYADLFVSLSQQYGIDLNWVLSYLQWENGFGAGHFSMNFNDPWDMLCGVPGSPCDGSNPPWGAIRCERAPNDYCYWVFPDMATGIESGYRNWVRYVKNGWTSWFSSLSVALCGDPAGCSSPWVQNVINQGDLNSQQWPYTGPPPPGPPPIFILPSSAMLLLLGSILAVGAAVGAYYVHKGGF